MTVAQQALLKAKVRKLVAGLCGSVQHVYELEATPNACGSPLHLCISASDVQCLGATVEDVIADLTQSEALCCLWQGGQVEKRQDGAALYHLYFFVSDVEDGSSEKG